MLTQTNIGVKLTVEGFHRFPLAVKMFGNEVSFLQERHRHNFQIVAKKKVSHDDRDVEFILFKRELENYIKRNYGTPAEFNDMSCEAIARDLLEAYDLEYCSVDEDNENFAEIFKTA